MHQKCSNNAVTNLLLGLCRSMWIIDPLIIHPSPHPKVLARPFTPKMLRTKERTPTLYFLLFSFLNLHLSLSRSVGVCQCYKKVYDTPPNSLMDSTTSPKGENNGRISSWGMLPSLQHFGGRGACWSSRMGIRQSDKQVNYSHRLAETK